MSRRASDRRSRHACRGVLVAALLSLASPAHAYEFWLRAKTYGQAYELRDFRLVGPDLFHGRRRITQTLALRLYDVGDLAAARRRARMPDGGPRITWQSLLRIDHDYGDYTAGRLTLGGPVRRDAIDVIPELAESVAGLDLLFGYVQVDGIADDRLAVQIGRLLVDDGWGTGALDGASARIEVPAPLAITASAGWRVRAGSGFGSSAFELDGTSGAACREYVEGPTPGTGSWQLVDRNRAIRNSRLGSDLELCPQRDMRQPTVGVTLATARMRRVGVELGYRRTWSDTVGLIGQVDRLDHPDLGYYPNELGQAPASGVDEERLHARVHADLRAGAFAVSPFAAARYSLLHGTFDRADAGLRVRQGAHVLEPAVEYFFPTFEGDSIFNAFSLAPTKDVRVGYHYAPAGPWRGRASAWLRTYDADPALAPIAGGVDAGAERTFGGGWRARIDGVFDDGWGGRRLGGAADAAWRGRGRVWVRGRLVVLGVREDDSSLARRFVTASAVASATFRISETVAAHAIVEIDRDRIHDLQTRGVGVIDLAFAPEP